MQTLRNLEDSELCRRENLVTTVMAFFQTVARRAKSRRVVAGLLRCVLERCGVTVGELEGLKQWLTGLLLGLEEKKESNVYSLNTPLPSTGNAGWTASSISIAPSSTGFVIPNGTGQGNRIGNRITTKRAWVKGILHQNIYDAVTNPQPLPVQVRMLIFKDKFNKSGQPAAVALDLFQTGSTAIGPQNDLVDIILMSIRTVTRFIMIR